MVIAQTLRVIRQDLDDFAFRHLPAITFADHSLELPLHRPKARESFLNVTEVFTSDHVYLRA